MQNIQNIQNAKRIVIKIGSCFIFDPKLKIVRYEWIGSLIKDVSDFVNNGKEVIIMSSGSFALGAYKLGMNIGKLKLSDKQSLSSVGLVDLISIYKKYFDENNVNMSNIVLTIADSEQRKHVMAIRETLDFQLKNGIVPIITNNDTISNTEIRFGEGDRLAARVAQMSKSDCLVLLSKVDGLFTDDPTVSDYAKFIPEVYAISAELEKVAQDSAEGTGGMSAKLAAAKIALASQCKVAITCGFENHPLKRLSDGAKATWFFDDGESKKQYIVS